MLIFDKLSHRCGRCLGRLLLSGLGAIATTVLLPDIGGSVVFAPALLPTVTQSMDSYLTRTHSTRTSLGAPPTRASFTEMESTVIQRPVFAAQQVRWQRVRFAPGASAATIKDSVLRGTRDIYLVAARQRQMMTIQLVSLENNATFDLLAPPNRSGKRLLLRQDAMTWTGSLPESGDYRIAVGATRGNASYRLVISIK